MTFEKIKEALKKWTAIRNLPEKSSAYLGQGCCFKIVQSQYEAWKKRSPESVYAYLGIFDNDLKFVLMDDITDKNPEENMDAVFVIDFLNGMNITEKAMIGKAIDGNITVNEAMKRNLNWILFKESWLENKSQTTEGVFRAFVLPFASLSAQFENDSQTESVLMIGLNDKDQADLILWKNRYVNTAALKSTTADDSSTTPVENFVVPCPPYGNPSN